MERALAPTTTRKYGSGVGHFVDFMGEHGVSEPFEVPITAMFIIGFIVWAVAMKHFAVSTVKGWRAGVRSFFLEIGADLQAFQSPMIARVLRGLEKTYKIARRIPKLPITTTLLHKYLHSSPPISILEITFFAIACVGVYGIFRAADLVDRGEAYSLLLRSDVTWIGDDASIYLKGSKHDYFNRGEPVRLHDIPFLTSPVRWLKLAYRLAVNKLPGAPLFQNPDGTAISYDQLKEYLKSFAIAVEMPAELVDTQSLRIGGAASLATLRVPAYIIRAMGRWKSMSYQLYTRMTEDSTRRAFHDMGALGAKQGAPFGSLTPEQACKVCFANIGQEFNLPDQ